MYEEDLSNVGWVAGNTTFPPFKIFLLLFLSIYSQILPVLDGKGSAKLSAEATCPAQVCTYYSYLRDPVLVIAA